MSDTAYTDEHADTGAASAPDADLTSGADVPIALDDDGDSSGEDGQPKPAQPVADLARRVDDLDKGLKGERGRRRAAEQRAVQLQAQIDAQRMQPPAQPQQRQAPPDPNQDPIGAIEHALGEINAYKAQQAQAQQQQQFQQQAQAQIGQIASFMDTAEADFAKDNPAYYKAAKYYTDERAKELSAFGASREAVAEQISREYLTLIATAAQQGRDPAATVYSLATSRGFNPAGGTKLDRIAAGQNASRSLSSVGGQPQNSLTLGALANLDGEAFDRAFAKMNAAQRKRESGAR